MSQYPTVYRFSGDGSLSQLGLLPDWLSLVVREANATGEWEDAMEDIGNCKIVEAYGVTNETLTVWRRSGDEWLVEYHDFDRPIMMIHILGGLDFWKFQMTQLHVLAQKIMVADRYHKDIRSNCGLATDEEEDAETDADSLSKLTRPTRMN
jgi:hypothetical protein